MRAERECRRAIQAPSSDIRLCSLPPAQTGQHREHSGVRGALRDIQIQIQIQIHRNHLNIYRRLPHSISFSFSFAFSFLMAYILQLTSALPLLLPILAPGTSAGWRPILPSLPFPSPLHTSSKQIINCSSNCATLSSKASFLVLILRIKSFWKNSSSFPYPYLLSFSS